MTIAVIGGTGWQGAGVAVRIAAAGHKAVIGSRTADRARELAAKLPDAIGLSAELFEGATNEEAARQAEMIFVTVPMTAHVETIHAIKPFAKGKIVVDVTAPVDPRNQIANLWPPEGSATQQAQAILEGVADVVGALKNISATALLNYRMASNCDVLIVGDDLTAKHRVMGLLREMKLASYDVGSGDVCRTVEGLTSMLIYLNYAYHLRQPGVKIAQIDPGLDFIPSNELLPMK
jgi:NADPH-dependent F420 reductase